MASDLKTALSLIGPLEGRIMGLVWQGQVGEWFTVRDVHEALGDPAYTTVMTTKMRLATKGILEVGSDGGRAYLYRCALTAHEFVANVGAAQVDGLIARFGDVALAAFSRRMDGLDAEQRRRLRRLGRP